MDKKTQNLIKHALRKATLRWSPRNEVLKAALVKIPRYKKDGTLSKQYYAKYRCAICSDIFIQKEVEVDHIKEVGIWDIEKLTLYVKRLFCCKSNLRVLCKCCHRRKTNRWRAL